MSESWGDGMVYVALSGAAVGGAIPLNTETLLDGEGPTPPLSYRSFPN